MRQLKAGVTLVELLIASTLSLLCIGLALELLFPALRTWASCQKEASIEHKLLNLYRHLSLDVGWAIPNSALVTPSGTLSMACSNSLIATSAIKPYAQVSYWRKGSKLYRVSSALDETQANDIPGYLLELETSLNQPLLIDDVSTLKFEVPQTWLVRVHITLDQGTGSRQGELMTAFTSRYAPIALPTHFHTKPLGAKN